MSQRGWWQYLPPRSVDGLQSNGIGFQLNCLPRAGGEITWQQYIMVVSRTGEDLGWGVNNWDGNPADSDGIIDQGGHLATLPSPFGGGYASTPAGYRFEIALSNDANDNISGATFSMYDQNGAPVFPGRDGCVDIPDRCPRAPGNGGRALTHCRHRFRHSGVTPTEPIPLSSGGRARSRTEPLTL